MNAEYIVGIGVLIILCFWFGGNLPKKYRNRDCMGKSWKAEFPNSSKDDIREFLLTFTDSFAFSSGDKLKFNPHDKLLEIYKELYPSKWVADAMEFETLTDELTKKYQVNLNDLWHDDLTLGELYSGVKNT
jgi:propanediol dehydratase small subunit